MENTETKEDDGYDIDYSQRERRAMGPNWNELPYDMHGNINPSYKEEELN